MNEPPAVPSENSRFLAFFDECGDHSLEKIDKDFPLFVLALVVAKRAAYRDEILPALNRLKLNYWNHEGINLHSRDIRLRSGPFSVAAVTVLPSRQVANGRPELSFMAISTYA